MVQMYIVTGMGKVEATENKNGIWFAIGLLHDFNPLCHVHTLQSHVSIILKEISVLLLSTSDPKKKYEQKKVCCGTNKNRVLFRFMPKIRDED